MKNEESIEAAAFADVWERFKAAAPRVHCITNSVAETFTANVLLAAGAVPSMTVNSDEVVDFVARADALIVNLGTLDETRRRAIGTGVTVARGSGKPWALDPVFVERSPLRAELARELVAQGPRVLRANPLEVAALVRDGGGAIGASAASEFAAERGVTLAMTGPEDLVTDGRRSLRLVNGHPLMARITATGCAATALVAGFMAVEDDALVAAAAGLAAFGLAAELAGAKAGGPGTLVPLLLDALHTLTPSDLAQGARID